MLLFVFRNIDLRETFGLVSRIGWFAPLLLSFYLAGAMCDTFAWKLLIRPSDDPVPFYRLLVIHLAGESFYRILPAGVVVGESVKIILMKKFSSFDTPEIISSLLIRKILLGIAQALYIALAVMTGIVLFSGAMNGLLAAGGLVLSCILLALFGLTGYFLFRGNLGATLFDMLEKIPSAAVKQFLGTHKASFTETDRVVKDAVLQRKRESIIACLFFLFGWMTEFLETWAILLSLNVSAEVGSALVIEPIVSLLRSIVFVIPAGIGVMDAGYAAAFRGLDTVTAGTFIAAFIVIKRSKEIFWVVIGVMLTSILGAFSESHSHLAQKAPTVIHDTIAERTSIPSSL